MRAGQQKRLHCLYLQLIWSSWKLPLCNYSFQNIKYYNAPSDEIG